MEHPAISNAANPEKVSRITIILVMIIRPILLIPQFIVLFIWGLLTFVILPVMWIIVIFTARYPAGLYNFVMGFIQKYLQVELYCTGLTKKYPPFALGSSEFRKSSNSINT